MTADPPATESITDIAPESTDSAPHTFALNPNFAIKPRFAEQRSI
jgi:hypothetical protein